MAKSSGAIRAGRAYLELFADKSKLVRTLKSAARDVQKWGATAVTAGKVIGAAGAGIVTPMLGMAKSFADAGGALLDMSQRTGASVEELSTLKYAAEQSGSSIEELESGMRKTQKVVADAAGGSKSAAAALKRLGVSAAELKGLTPDEQFRRIADGAASIADPGERAAAIMGVMGKSATKLLPLMLNGADGIRQMQEEAREVGVEMSTADAQGAEGFGDAINKAWRQIGYLKNGLAKALLPTLMEFLKQASATIMLGMKWVKENKGLVVTIFKIGGALLAGGAALTAFGYALGAVGTALGVAAGLLPIFGAVLGAVLSPLGLTVAAIAAVTGGLGYLVAQTDVGKAALGTLGETFGSVAADAQEAWGGITAALSSGDIGAAAAIAWGLVKLEFTRGIAWVEGLWSEFTTGLNAIWIDTWYGLSDVVGESIGAIESFWNDFTTGLLNVWYETIGWLAEKWEAFVGWLDGKDSSAVQAGIAADTKSKVDANNKAHAAEKQRIEDERRGNSTAREAARAAEQEANQREHNDTMLALTDEVEKARKEFSKSVVKAKDASQQSTGMNTKQAAAAARAAGQGTPAPDLSKMFSAGTFMGATANQALSSQGELDRIAKATEQTARNTTPGRAAPGPKVTA